MNKDVLVKIRSTGKLLNAKINFKENNSAEVNLKELEDGISPGQACVFYNLDKQGHKVLGGGWIVGWVFFNWSIILWWDGEYWG